MRLFQNSGLYPAYFPRLLKLRSRLNSYSEYRAEFLHDRFGACHFLNPVLNGSPSAFFTNGDDAELQKKWALEQGMSSQAGLPEILLAQIEHHRTEVFYNLDPMRYSSEFVRRLPACVKHSIAWRAAPSPGADFSAYNRVVCNFPSILDGYRKQGWRAAYFSPAHDPVMDTYAANQDRPVDVLFVGGYTRHHARRAALLEAVAALPVDINIAMYLDCSRLTRLAESPIGKMLPLGKHRRPANIRRVARPPLFGLDLYGALSRSKIVLNGAIDMAGDDRGNMRCFETMGTGALLLSDAGNYPEGMRDQETLITYTDIEDAVARIRELLLANKTRAQVAEAGHRMVRTRYSKSQQWLDFQALVA